MPTNEQANWPTPTYTYQSHAPLGEDGYEWHAAQDNAAAWVAIYDWGAHGWSLPDYPYVAFAITHKATHVAGGYGWGIRQYVEGDVTTWCFRTEAERDEYLDRVVWWYWQRNPSRYFSARTVALLDTAAELPPTWLRGRYSHSRKTEVPWLQEDNDDYTVTDGRSPTRNISTAP